MTKKIWLHPGKLWLEALHDFENELHEHVEKAGKDELRFQTGRLLGSLTRRIKAKASGKDEWRALFDCYQFVTDTSRHLGYDEARRLHGEEMRARALSSPHSFCSSLGKQCARDLERSLKELLFRAGSIAAWMEAQGSFSLWMVFKDFHRGWRGSLDERAQAIQALILSQLPQRLLTKTKHRGRVRIGVHLRPERGVGTNYENKPWNDRQWKNILEQAARLTEKRWFECGELEKWLWWCHSVFRRYRWNTRQILEAAIQRRFIGALNKPEVEDFRRRMLTIGLPVSGRKQKRNRTPPLAEFVRDVVLPESGKLWGAFGGFLTQKS
jgi:hypothetical protein